MQGGVQPLLNDSCRCFQVFRWAQGRVLLREAKKQQNVIDTETTRNESLQLRMREPFTRVSTRHQTCAPGRKGRVATRREISRVLYVLLLGAHRVFCTREMPGFVGRSACWLYRVRRAPQMHFWRLPCSIHAATGGSMKPFEIILYGRVFPSETPQLCFGIRQRREDRPAIGLAQQTNVG